jgi:glycosyltransferase involved in cell wall biosynthesis
MNILYIAGKIPYPIYLDGGTLMNYHVMQGLKKNHNIDFLTFSQEGIPMGFIEGLCHNFYGVQQNSKISISHYIRSVMGLLPPFHFNKSNEFVEKLDALTQNNNYDVIFIDSIYMEIYSVTLKHPNKVISLHDSISLLYNTFTAGTNNILLKIYYEFCSYVFKKYELRILNQYSKCFFVSKKDEEYLIKGKNDIVSSCVIPNGYNLDLINKNSNQEVDSNSIVFSGIMDYKPNIDAVIHFVKSIFPLILMVKPDVKFYIIGKNPSKEVCGLKSENVIITGWVESISEYICKGTVYVSPLVSGAGLKNKIIEAMALKIAIVATSLSVDGIDVQDDEHLYIADSAEVFASRVIELIDNREKRDKFVKNSHDLILKKYNWENILKKYEMEIIKSSLT